MGQVVAVYSMVRWLYEHTATLSALSLSIASRFLFCSPGCHIDNIPELCSLHLHNIYSLRYKPVCMLLGTTTIPQYQLSCVL